MTYDFDRHIDRVGTDCVKYDAIYKQLERCDVKPLWIADMDFETPPFVIRAIENRLRQRVLGYTCPSEGFYKSIINWMQRRHGVSLESKDIHFVPGIVPALHHAICALTEKGDKVLIQPPVYHPFAHIININERVEVDSPLRVADGRFEMDFDDLERKLPECKMMILCNPHNPGGTVWASEVLGRLAALCKKHNVIVLSDEIHSDMTHSGHKYTPFVNVSDDARDISIALNAPSKTFNMPGVVVSYCYSLSHTLRRRYFTFLERADVAIGNVFACDCLEACYSDEGEQWLCQMLNYVTDNIRFVEDYLAANCPRIKPMKTEASFLMFLDHSEMPFAAADELQDFYLNKAGLYLNQGHSFGCTGEAFMRLNVALPRAELTQALDKLKAAYDAVGPSSDIRKEILPKGYMKM